MSNTYAVYIGLTLAAVAVGWALVDEFWSFRRRRRVATAAPQPDSPSLPVDRIEMSETEVFARFADIAEAAGPPLVWPEPDEDWDVQQIPADIAGPHYLSDRDLYSWDAIADRLGPEFPDY